MKYAILDGKLTHISKVKKGTIARVFGYSDDLVIAVGGRERKYWKFRCKTYKNVSRIIGITLFIPFFVCIIVLLEVIG